MALAKPILYRELFRNLWKEDRTKVSGFVGGTSLSLVGYQILLRLFWFSGLNAWTVGFFTVHETADHAN